MASRTKKYKIRKKLKNAKAGRDRKNLNNRDGSTPPKSVFFGDEPKKSDD